MVSVKKNFIYNSLYQILLIVLPLITVPYISRILGPEAIGQFSYSYAIAVLFVMFSMLGLNNYGNRTIAEFKNSPETLRRKFWEIYVMQLIVSTIVLLVYLLYVIFIDDSVLSMIMLIYIISAVFDVNWLFFGLELFKYTAVRSIVIKTLMTLCIFIFVKTESDLAIYSVIICLSSLLSQLVLWPYVIKNIKPIKVARRQIIRHIIPNFVLFIPVIAIGIYRYMDKVMLGAMSSSVEVGFYESSDKIVYVPMALITALGAVMLPRIANLMSKNNKSRINNYMEKSVYFAMLISSLLCFGIMAVSKSFVPLYYGDGFEKCIYLFYVLLPSCLFLAFANVIRTQYLIPAKKDKIYVVSVVIGAIINVVANLILIPFLQSVGAAIGTLLAQVFVCAFQAYKVRNEIKVKTYFLNSIPIVLSGIIMFVVVFLLDSNSSIDPVLRLFCGMAVGAVVYFVSIIIFMRVFKINYYRILSSKNL